MTPNILFRQLTLSVNAELRLLLELPSGVQRATTFTRLSEDKRAAYLAAGFRLMNREGHDGLIVTAIYCTSAAWQAGIRVGDELLAINGTSLARESLLQIETLLQKPMPKLTLTVRPPGAKAPQTVTLSTVEAVPASTPAAKP